ncbi:hypothetical protein K431DRAFT_338340 [Polychaeton citri CBS 116435]|uniref:Transcription factor domain-containing protein n=1 Tax=Polychaeton citri CBS 116435 TaxID=1314669 RepID=A0A9P4UN83_9PEZI|nr:hypothetical protein K431DRAFT_338340 [Polychaeton citri CBS 116435]
MSSANSSRNLNSSWRRQKGIQVARACELSRQYRIKGEDCSKFEPDVATFPHVHREIQRLRREIEELERELQHERSKASTTLGCQHCSPETPESMVSQDVGFSYEVIQRVRDGIQVRATHATSETWYEPSSLFYFIGRPTQLADQVLSGSSTSNLLDDTEVQGAGTQEDIFWRSYHTAIFLILNKNSFRVHYRSMLTAYGDSRKPSALVDISHTKQDLPEGSNNDVNIAGRCYCLRCQTLLAYELESPIIATLQCQLLCSNMLDSVCSTATRTAYMVGLHLDPPNTMHRGEKEMRRRLYKICMRLGRPFSLSQPVPPARLPDDSLLIANMSGSDFAPLGNNITWLTFNVQHIKLVTASRAIYTAFWTIDVSLRDGSTNRDNAPATVALEKFLIASMKDLEQWVDSISAVLKTRRKHDMRPYSTDKSHLEIENFALLWLQRQRLFLELIYHHLCTNAGWYEAFRWQWNAVITLVGFILAYPRATHTAAARTGIEVSIAALDIFGNNFPVAISAAKVVRRLIAKIDSLMQQSPTQELSALRISMADRAELPPHLTSDERTLQHMASNNAVTAETNGSAMIYGDTTPTALQDVFNMAFDIEQWNDLEMLW